MNQAQVDMNMKSQPDIRPPLSPIPKDSDRGVQQNSPLTGDRHLSILNTDDASGLDNSIIGGPTSDNFRREFNEIDVLGDLERDDRGNVIVPLNKKTGAKASTDRQGRPIN